MSSAGSVMVLGVTGGIASGKSYVSAIMAELGAVVVSADDLAREAVAPGSPVLDQLVDIFGKNILTEAGELDRSTLGHRIFQNHEERQKLNAITLPAIAALSERRLAALRSKAAPLVVYEAPLLFEAGAESRVDKTLVVFVEAEIQLARLCARDGIDREAAAARVAAQWPQYEKVKRADFVVDNSGSMQDSRRQVEAVFRYLTRAVPTP
jgi:dephospho-CoA kinase